MILITLLLYYTRFFVNLYSICGEYEGYRLKISVYAYERYIFAIIVQEKFGAKISI